MKKRTRILALGLVLTSLFYGCGTKGTEAASGASASTAASPEAEASVEERTSEPQSAVVQADEGSTAETETVALPITDEVMTYSMWTTYAPFAADLVDTKTLEGMLVLDRIQEISNIHFDITAANGAAEADNFQLMIASGDYCDIIGSLENYRTGFEGAVDDGIVQDLAAILPEKCPIYWNLLSQDTATLMRAYTDSGYMPAICCLSPELGQENFGMVLRQDWLDEFGMEMPNSYDTLYEYLEQAYTKKNATFYLSTTDGLVGDLAAGLNISLDGYEVVDGAVEYGKAQNAFQDYLRFMNKLYHAGIISQDFFSQTSEDLNTTARLAFGAGSNSLLITSAANTTDAVNNVTEESFSMAVLPYVSLDGSTEAHLGPDTMLDNIRDNDTWAISTECRDIDPLLSLVDWLFTDEGYLLTNYGIENETYTLDEDGQPHYTDLVINNPDGLSYFFASYVYATNAASSHFPYMNDLTRSFYDFNDNQWEIYEDLKTLSDCTYNYPAYAQLSTEEAVTYSELESELNTYVDSKVLEFVTGTLDIDKNFDDFVQTMYDMGLTDMLKLKQDAYDRAMERMENFTA